VFIGNKYIQRLNNKTKIHFSLGLIKERSDKRWTWIRLVSEYNKDWNKKTGYIQGTSLKEKEAKEKILEGWN